MAEETHTESLLDRLMKYPRIPWYWNTAVVAAVLLLFLVFMVYLDGFFVLGTAVARWSFWRDYLDSPVMPIYILMIYPVMRRLRNQAIQTFRSLLPLKEDDSSQTVTEIFVPNRRWEWGAVLIGAFFWLATDQPWNWWWGPGAFWLHVYEVVTFLLLFSLLGWLIYDTLAGILHLSRLSRQDLKLDIFDTGLLTPIARSSLGISLTFIGGISLSMVFQTPETLLQWDDITIYSILVCVTILIFFLSMWSVHRVMTDAKKRKLDLARKHLAGASHELEDRTAQNRLDRIEGLSFTIAAWVNYERRVQEVPTWPFNAAIIRRLMASIIIPAIVYLIKILSGLGFRF
jgi:hypothetical protein